jgi:molybdate transport system ATP-binding protein
MSLEVDIKKTFGSYTLDVSFTAEDEVFGLLGASGCGKSLTMRSIAGIETPDEGRIVVNGKVFFDSEKGINLKPQERKTALLFQNYMLFPNLTVEQNVAAGIPKDTPKDERDRIVAEELQRFDVAAFGKRYPAQLSGGQQQRVALARMLAARPGILMLDEPFSALDSHLKSVLEQNLTGLFEMFEGTILYVSHDIDEAVRFCDSIAVMEQGKLMEVDKGRELIESPKSLAGIKLGGCKNAPDAEYVDDHTVYCPQWGVEIHTEQVVPRDVKAIGLRAFNLQLADGPGPDVFRMRVDRVSDSRFDRMALLEFLDRREDADELVAANEQEMHYLHQRVFWRLDAGQDKTLWDQLPDKGDELWIRIPVGKIYIVNK